MNKEEFLTKLRKKIDILEESEIDDILEEYAGFIDEKVSQGFTEEEAVKSMGNINELSRDLLSAYKIKNPKEKNGDVINNFVDEFLKIVESIINVFANKSFKEIVRFIIEIIFILIIIAICKIPFEMLRAMGSNIIINMSSSFENVGVFHLIAGIGNMFLEICYLIFAIILFVKIFQSRYMTLDMKEEKNLDDTTKVVNNKKSTKEVKKKISKVSNQESHGLGIIDGLTNICVAFIKVIAFCILIGVICWIIGMTTAFGLSIYLIIKGVLYFGFYLAILSLLFLGIIVFKVLFDFVFNRKGNLFILLITSLSCFILLGISIAICTVEVASTTIIYDEKNQENFKVETIEYEMKDNLVLDGSYDEFIIDEELGNKIKIEYSYNDEFVKLSLYPSTFRENDFEILHHYYDMNTITYNKKIFDQIINDLKNKTIKTYNFDVNVKIYASSEVKSKLTENYKKYEVSYDYDYEDYDLETLCYGLHNGGYELPGYCLPFITEEEM